MASLFKKTLSLKTLANVSHLNRLVVMLPGSFGYNTRTPWLIT